ncbi:hypothetical protein A3D06_00840 [Candidatus Roizmanbacteria bacterium RIFCSPHIGHO2_02_FULL_40_9]|uniref:Glycosyltransferase 2-like domain-containing protein n=2 Tax=Candidatus Roizmaniibacteriota TaxID=1752723 RepID=A0A1F7ILX3_9BACT|nr:MAG: hypothetical protein A3D06_00840 [Candidatus Roizmanbacteria bacterium RIFCSPHIGHO2_02_FULL_40_9]OGK44387.1 MAG: hypothetical protein A2957_00810 [Candidatus Roizmanbacteria bacterium RIFCSPLOWO2_01_FULL_38_11]
MVPKKWKLISAIAIVIPVYNEEKYLKKFLPLLLKETASHKEINKVVIVNDGSTDNTNNILESFSKKIHAVQLKGNRGKGYAMRVGIEAARSFDSDAIIFMDGDLQHDPKSLSEFIETLRANNVVLGYRKLEKTVPFYRKFGNLAAQAIFRVFFNIKRKDLLCGFIAFHISVLDNIKWQSNGYGVETEITALIAKHNIPYKEIRIDTIYLDPKKGVTLMHAAKIFLRLPGWYATQTAMLYPIFFVLVAIGLILSLKNPYTTRSLIPNLEPYPDTLYYAYPAFNFVKNGDFSMIYHGFAQRFVTPAAYTVYLLPFFFIFKSILAFFWANIILLVMSIFLFVKVALRLFHNRVIPTFFAGFLFVTNFYTYTMPSLLMAELISMTVFIGMIYLLFSEKNTRNIVFGALLGSIMVLIKFSNAPISVFFIMVYGLLILLEKKSLKKILIFIGSLAVLGVLSFIYIRSAGILTDHKNLQSGSSFSTHYFQTNVMFYKNALLGQPSRYLWYHERLISLLVSILLGVGVVLGLTQRTYRKFTLIILTFIVSLVFFMSFFVTPDARYIVILLPTIMVMAGITIDVIQKKYHLKIGLLLVSIFIAAYLFIPQFGQRDEMYAKTLKKQIGLNYLHAENPWNYIALTMADEFAKNADRPVYIGTFLPPYYAGMVAEHITALPLTSYQEFYSNDSKIHFGNESFNSVVELLENKMKKGDVYITSAYANNVRGVWPQEFDKILHVFETKLAYEGCFGTCNLYKLVLKK